MTELLTYQPDLTPDRVVLGELTIGELKQSSGIYDPELGRDLSNLEAVAMVERAAHGVQAVTVDGYAHLSEESRVYNRAMARYFTPGYEDTDLRMVALVSHRPTEAQLAYRAIVTAALSSSSVNQQTDMPTHHLGNHGTTHAPHHFEVRQPVLHR